MDLILLLIFAFTVKGDSDETKYIDLLPQAEKEEFLQKVARRIDENVEVKEVSNKSSVEIPDEELKQHDALIKKIIKEETRNIRRHRNEKVDSEEDVSVKSIENLKEMQRAGNLVMTLRTDSRNRRDAGKSSEITVEVITENVTIKTNNFGSEVQTKTSDEKANNNEYAQSSREDIQVRHVDKPTTKNTETTINIFVAEESSTTVVLNETVQNTETKFADSSKEDSTVKSIKRRAIENNTTPETVDTDDIKANNSNINDTESISASKEHKPTLIDHFDPIISGEETTEYETTATNTPETSTIETPTIQETTVNETTEVKGNETTENYQFTQAIYDSEIESDRDCSNETVNDEATVLSNTSVVEMPTSVRYLRSNDYDIVTDAARVNNPGNQMDTIEINAETVTDTNIDDIVQSSTTNEGSTDNIIGITATISDSGGNDHKSTGTTVPPIDIDENNDAAEDIILPGTGDSNSDTVPSNTQQTIVFSDVTTTTEADIITVEDISETNKEETLPTPVPYMRTNETTEGAMNLTSRTRFAIVNGIRVDEATEIGAIKNVTETVEKNNMITATIPSTTDNELRATILTATESIITTTNIPKPAKTTKGVEKKINNKKKKAATTKIKYTTKPPVQIIDDKPIQVADKAVDMLRDSLLLVNNDKKTEADVFKDLQKEFYKQLLNNKKNKEYQVYEIPADKPPFIRDSVAIKEQPYYVPVYNYSPNKAYFNAHNRLGPNADDKDIHLIDEESDTEEENAQDPTNEAQKSDEYDSGRYFKDSPNIFNDYFVDDNQRKKFGSQGAIPKLGDKKMSWPMKLPIIARKPADKDNNYNPDDYVDLDYANRIAVDSDRCSKEKTTTEKPTTVFPDSDDDNHPFHSMHKKNLKDHVSAVRHILSQNNLFSYPYIPEKPATTSEPEPEMEINPDSRFYRNGEKSSAIALDYYFGRMKPEDSNEKKYYKKVGYFKKYNKSRDLYMNKEVLSDNIVKYINLIKYKGDTYISSDTATPHTDMPAEIIPNLTQESIKVPNKIKILNAADTKDVYNTLETLDEFNETLNNQDSNLNVYIRVLKDMVHLDNNALKQYDWLGTTVDLQSALDKLMGLIEGVQSIEEIHPSDLELLKYVVFLHKFSNDLMQSKFFADKLRMLYLHPNMKKKNRIIKEKGLLKRVWLYRRKQLNGLDDNNLEKFNNFLMDLQEALYDFHVAIKHIANITTFKKQNWFKNIKELYLTDDESYLSLLLHLTAVRLFGLIEESAASNLEADSMSYIKNNRESTMKALEEMLFVIKISHEVNRDE